MSNLIVDTNQQNLICTFYSVNLQRYVVNNIVIDNHIFDKLVVMIEYDRIHFKFFDIERIGKYAIHKSIIDSSNEKKKSK